MKYSWKTFPKRPSLKWGNANPQQVIDNRNMLQEWEAKVLQWVKNYKAELRELALDEEPYKGQYNGLEMLAIHLFIQKEILGE